MATIEERAAAYAERYNIPETKELTDILVRLSELSYKVGATQQRELDIRNACDIHCRMCDAIKAQGLTEGAIVCILHTDRFLCPKLEMIRKAMEKYHGKNWSH